MEERIKVFIVDDDEFSLENIALSLPECEFEITKTGSSEEAIELLTHKKFDIAILDLKLNGASGIDIIEKVKTENSLTKYLLVTGYSEEEAFIKATRLGVNDILKKPYEEFELLSSIKKLIHLKRLEEENLSYREKLQKENEVLKTQLNRSFDENQNIIIGDSPLLKNALDKAKSVAQYSMNTLIIGETGTGKELLARYIQRNGARSDKPFVPVNCASLTESLFESELFGYEKGAFTNATSAHSGLFEVANGGIIFLDEITEIPISLQAKLLRVIQERKIKRVGSTKEIDIDVQILSSTNRNIVDAVRNGILREDLYHRIASIEIELPPLRKRLEDLEMLAEHFINVYCRMFNNELKEITDEIRHYIRKQRWEGNIRQFSNFIKNYCIFGSISRDEFQESDIIEKQVPQFNFNNEVKGRDNSPTLVSETGNYFKFENGNLEELEEAKKWLINQALKKYNGNKTQAAKHLGVSYQGLAYLIKSKVNNE